MADSVQTTLNWTQRLAICPIFQELLPVWQWLDKLLESAIAAAQIAYGSEAASDPYRGLHVTLEEMEQLLNREPGVSPFLMEAETGEDSLSNLISENSPLHCLQQTYGLSDFDLEVVAIALAPEIDRRYERLYAYLQENVSCTLPSVDLALNLLCNSGAAKLIQRDRFAPNAPLIQHCLLDLIPDPDRVKSTLLGHYIVLDEQVIRLLLGQKGLDSRLAPFCQLVQPTLSLKEIPLQADVKQALAVITIEGWQKQKPLRFYFEGADRAIAEHTRIIILAGVEFWKPSATSLKGIVTVTFTIPDFSLRRFCWQTHLTEAGVSIEENDLDALVDRFRLTPDQIADVVATACNHVHWNTAANSIDPEYLKSEIKNPELIDLYAAARAQSGHELTAMAQKIEPKDSLDDLVLPTDQQTQLREICNQT